MDGEVPQTSQITEQQPGLPRARTDPHPAVPSAPTTRKPHWHTSGSSHRRQSYLIPLLSTNTHIPTAVIESGSHWITSYGCVYVSVFLLCAFFLLLRVPKKETSSLPLRSLGDALSMYLVCLSGGRAGWTVPGRVASSIPGSSQPGDQPGVASRCH